VIPSESSTIRRNIVANRSDAVVAHCNLTDSDGTKYRCQLTKKHLYIEHPNGGLSLALSLVSMAHAIRRRTKALLVLAIVALVVGVGAVALRAVDSCVLNPRCSATYDPDLGGRTDPLRAAAAIGLGVGLFLLGRWWWVPRHWLVVCAGPKTSEFNVSQPDKAYRDFVTKLQSSIG
jgi:hypothetical protein